MQDAFCNLLQALNPDPSSLLNCQGMIRRLKLNIRTHSDRTRMKRLLGNLD
jgi:hypothetical protein